MALRHDPRLIAQALAFARRQIGVPYTWGGTTRSGGFDCSGLVWAAYRQAGYTGIGRTTYDQIKQGRAVDAAHLRPGDIVFPTAHHEGIYVGNGMVLEAPHTGDVVKLIPLGSFGFMTARRLIGGGGGIIPPRGIGGQGALGLPTPHPDPAMRAPDPGAAALSSLLGQLAAPRPLTQTHLNLPTPTQTLTNAYASLPKPPADLNAGAAPLPPQLAAPAPQIAANPYDRLTALRSLLMKTTGGAAG